MVFEYISAALVLIGALLILGSLYSAIKTYHTVPDSMKGKWRGILYLMVFFTLAYLAFDFILLHRIELSVIPVTSVVFLGGALFVLSIIRLTQSTVTRLAKTEEDLQDLNMSLERQIADRTRDFRTAHDFSNRIIQTIHDSLCIIDPTDFRILKVNRAFLNEVKKEEYEVLGRFCYDITHKRSSPCHPPQNICPLLDTLASGDFATAEHIHFASDGSKIFADVQTSPIKNEAGEIRYIVHTSRNITRRKEDEQRIQHLAYYDSLTNLPNRFFFQELLDRAIKSAERNAYMLAVMFIDLDGFKRVNDNLGHTCGDELIKLVGERLARSLRKSDQVARSVESEVTHTVSRVGGDEFVILLSRIGDLEDVHQAVRRVQHSLGNPFLIGDEELHISSSIGISVYPNDGPDAETLLRNADISMYQAKSAGKNGYRFFTGSYMERVFDDFSIERDLREALARSGFELYYQPKIDVRSNNAPGMEALLRWKHPRLGLLLPEKFINVAEQSGLILTIGEWVIREACRQNREWQGRGLGDLIVAVNLSGNQFQQDDLVERIDEILEQTGMRPELLELEITESTLMSRPEQAIVTLNGLRERGIRISIDDFGTGYSSLNYLQRLPISGIKIDRSFVSNVTTKNNDAVLARAIIAMAQSLSLEVIAEGVETPEQLKFIRETGCQQAQGYLFSAALPAEEFAAFILDLRITGSSGPDIRSP